MTQRCGSTVQYLISNNNYLVPGISQIHTDNPGIYGVYSPHSMASPIISVAEGEQFANDYLATLHECFQANDMTKNKALHADTVKWDWSGDISGEGTKEEFFTVLANSWQLVCSQFLPRYVSGGKTKVFTTVEHGFLITEGWCLLDLVSFCLNCGNLLNHEFPCFSVCVLFS